MTFTPGSKDPELTDTIEAQRKGLGLHPVTGEPLDPNQTEKEFEEAQSGLNQAADFLYDVGVNVPLLIGSGFNFGSVATSNAFRDKLKGKEVNPAQVSVNYGPNDGFGGWEPVIDEVLNKDFETFHTEKETIIPQYSSGDIVQTEDGPFYRAKDIANIFYSMNNTEDKDDEPKYDLNEILHPSVIGGTANINQLLVKHGGMRGGRLNLTVYETYNTLDKRIAATVYLTPFGKGSNFSKVGKEKKSIVYQIFGDNFENMGMSPITAGGTSGSVQAHHKDAPIKAVLPGFAAIVKESPRYTKFVNLFLDNMLALGDMPENIIGVLGHTAREPDSPHAISHVFTRYLMGEDGRDFWTKDKLDQIVVYDEEGNMIGTKNDDLREEFMLEQIALLKDNLEVLNNATEQYEILFKQGIQDPATVIDYFEDKLPNLKGEFIGLFVPKLLDKFSAEIISTEAAEVKQNPVTTSTRNEIINNIFKRSNVKQWRTWSVPKRKALMKEITGTEALDYEDGFTFEQIEAYIDAGWLDDERLEELFRDPLDWEGIIDK